MSKYVVAPIAAGILLAVAGTAQAVTKQTTFQVSATVATNCVIGAAPLNLGTFDGTNDLTNTSSITVRCTNGTPFNVNLSTGGSGDFANRVLSGGAAGNLVYNLYTNNAYNTIWGDNTAGTGRVGGSGAGMAAPQTLTVYGRLLASQNQGAVDAGSYTDTITATVVY
jgi:spore coat protein U-like protein